MNRIGGFLSLIGALVALDCNPAHLAGSGTLMLDSVATKTAANAAVADSPLQRLWNVRRNGVVRWDEPPSRQDSKDGEDVLKAVFDGVRDPELADIVMYYQDIAAPPLVFLMQGEKMRRVLGRETQAWVVLLVDRGAGETKCPTFALKLEGVGAAQLDPSISLESALSSMLQRKDLDTKPVAPKEEYVETVKRHQELTPLRL